jgi:lipopolysaccharide/colanic/teichoic acid biosynthesis glycosyltransferase
MNKIKNQGKWAKNLGMNYIIFLFYHVQTLKKKQRCQGKDCVFLFCNNTFNLFKLRTMIDKKKKPQRKRVTWSNF